MATPGMWYRAMPASILASSSRNRSSAACTPGVATKAMVRRRGDGSDAAAAPRAVPIPDFNAARREISGLTTFFIFIIDCSLHARSMRACLVTATNDNTSPADEHRYVVRSVQSFLDRQAERESSSPLEHVPGAWDDVLDLLPGCAPRSRR